MLHDLVQAQEAALYSSLDAGYSVQLQNFHKSHEIEGVLVYEREGTYCNFLLDIFS